MVFDNNWAVDELQDYSQKYDDKTAFSKSGTFSRDGFAVMSIHKDCKDGLSYTQGSKLYIKIGGKTVFSRPSRQDSGFSVTLPVKSGTTYEVGISGSPGGNAEGGITVFLLYKP